MSIFIKPYWIKNIWNRVVPKDARFSVTFRSRDLSADDAVSYTDYALSYAKFRTSDVAEGGESGSITEGFYTSSFLLWQSDLDAVSAPDPKVGDIIVCEGINWQIDRAKNTLMREVWDVAVKQVT